MASKRRKAEKSKPAQGNAADMSGLRKLALSVSSQLMAPLSNADRAELIRELALDHLPPTPYHLRDGLPAGATVIPDPSSYRTA